MVSLTEALAGMGLVTGPLTLILLCRQVALASKQVKLSDHEQRLREIESGYGIRIIQLETALATAERGLVIAEKDRQECKRRVGELSRMVKALLPEAAESIEEGHHHE